MAKFLTTTGVSHMLENMIKSTKKDLVLISPYLQLSERIKENLKYLCSLNINIVIIYRENSLNNDDKEWIKDQYNIETRLCKNLHAKCYINENEAIITSMNLYQFSQENNNEMGIHILKSEKDLYDSIEKEVDRLLKISNEFPEKTKAKNKEIKNDLAIESNIYKGVKIGYCIRTGEEILFDLSMPMCNDAYKKWLKYSDTEYKEKYCHFSGEKSNGETTFSKPVLKQYWKKAVQLNALKS